MKLLAPFLPYVTEEIWQHLFAPEPWASSLHRAAWPEVDERWEDSEAEARGETLIEIATAVRRYKSERSMSLGAELEELVLVVSDPALAAWLAEAGPDLRGVTRSRTAEVRAEMGAAEVVLEREGLRVGVRGHD